MTKIKKILIANRGEIACRVIKTARKMGIKTVAVYSDADRNALHVRMADEALHIGPSPAAESYLIADKIIDACKSSGADAVHPGYGFLSENPSFARRLKKEGITFIGPAPESMEAMGLKDAAKTLMIAAGVPVTPGYQDDNQDPKHLKKAADDIGYPVLIKAVAGGGGKGMRKVDASDDFIDALASCQREAKSSFGNDIVLIEKYITSPRHIEVQVFGDTHGNVVHMYERDCSLQRRHQKVIEEAPAPGMTDAVRKAMTDAAVNAAKAVNYVGAGTVEFIVDGSGTLKEDGFWFMEMNTRLQVEHPVTEMITGLDLVELQIRVAQGEKLPMQKDISIDGHAIEARLYAEDPINNFLPSIGEIRNIDTDDWSDGSDTCRIDTGVTSGDKISIYYDPMIAKIIGHGDTRDDAIATTRNGIVNIEAYPLTNNAAFLYNCLGNDAFANGHISTNFIQQNNADIIPYDLIKGDDIYALAALRLAEDMDWATNKTPFGKPSGWRMNQSSRRRWTFAKDDGPIDVEIVELHADFAHIRVGENEPITISREPNLGIKSVSEALKSFGAWSYKVTDDYVSLTAQAMFVQVYFYRFDDNVLAGGNSITSPMPGKIISVEAKVGDTVKAGDKLIVMEAMKMEMSLDAPRDGIIASVNVSTDDLVSDGDVLLELEKEE